MKRIALTWLLVLWSAAGAAAQERARLIVRPSIGHVTGHVREGRAMVGEAPGLVGYEAPVRIEFEPEQIAIGLQAQYNLDRRFLLALGGEASTHRAEITAFSRPHTQDRQLLSAWVGPGFRWRFATLIAGPLLVREDIGSPTHFPATQIEACPHDRNAVSHWGWTGAAALEIPVSRYARLSASAQRHAIQWSADAIGLEAGRSTCIPQEGRLRSWNSANTTEPAIWSLQAGVAIPVF